MLDVTDLAKLHADVNRRAVDHHGAQLHTGKTEADHHEVMS